MAGLGDFFGKGSIGEQLLLWGILNQVIGAAISPGIVEIQSTVNELAPLVPLSPAELAALVARGFAAESENEGDAKKSGIDSARFRDLVKLARSTPGSGELVAALQRGIIARGSADGGDISFDGGLADSGLDQAWIDVIAKLAVQIPTVAEVMNAWLEGQIERDEAHTRYIAAGGDPTWFQTSYNANGQAPTPMEALTMLNRGLIPSDGSGPESISYHQAFLEGPWRNKWETPFRGLGIYVPPARTVTAMLREGSITEAEALAYWHAEGLSVATAAQYLAAASHHSTEAQRALSQAQIVALYEDKLVTKQEAHDQLVALRYTSGDATLILELADLKAAHAASKQATTRLRTLYLAGRNSRDTTIGALHTLGIPDDQAGDLVAVWDLEMATSTRVLSAAQIESAFQYELFDQATAQAELVGLGYTPHDAWILLSIKAKGALPDEP